MSIFKPLKNSKESRTLVLGIPERVFVFNKPQKRYLAYEFYKGFICGDDTNLNITMQMLLSSHTTALVIELLEYEKLKTNAEISPHITGEKIVL